MHDATGDMGKHGDGDPDEPGGMMYRVPIWDPSLPAFASGVAHVYGTRDDLRDFMEVRRSACHDTGDSVLDAYDTWCASGFEDVPTVNVAYGDMPFVTECPTIGGTARGSVRDYDETYMNIWGFPYEVHIDDGGYERMLVQDGDRYVIVEKTSVRGMTLDALASGRMPVESSWGEPGIVSIEGAGMLRTTMFLVASAHDSESEALDALNHDASPSIEALMSQIVADG